MKCFEFIYIVHPDVYKKHVKKGIFKYLPEQWLKKMKPKFVTDFTNEKKSTIGKGVGLFFDIKNISKDEYIKKVIIGVKAFKTGQINSIVLDNLNILNSNDIEFIRRETGLTVVDGQGAIVYFLPYVIKELSILFEEKLLDKEILIISDGSTAVYDLIKNLAKEVRFLTVIGDDEEKINKISSEVYNETGLSIFYTKNINKILKNHSIIINFKESISIDLRKLRGKTIVFDLSLGKSLSETIEKINNNILVIEDFLFSYDHLIKEREYFDTMDEVPSYKYEVFYNFNHMDFKKVLSRGKKYTLKEIVKKTRKYIENNA